jgi:hypothetical protein
MKTASNKIDLVKPWSCIGTCIGLIFLSGCASPTITITQLDQSQTQHRGASVKVYNLGKAPTGDYEVLGVVSAHSDFRGDKPWSSAALNKLKNEAALMGANALVGYYGKHFSGMTFTYGWSSALAARMLKPGESPTNPKPDCIIAIPHAQVAPDVADEKKAIKLAEWSRDLAQYCLVKRGYYVELVNERLPRQFESGFANMSGDRLMRYGGKKTDKIMGIEFVGSKGFNLGLGTGAAKTLELATFSKSKRKMDWSNTAAGSRHIINLSIIGLSAGLGDIFVPSAKHLESIHSALENGLQDFPVILTNFKK